MNNSTKQDFFAYLVFAFLFGIYIIIADYGHRVDQFPYFDNAKIDINNIGNALERNSINGIDSNQLEEPNKWLMRFRLYSIDADEVNNIMALARIKPAKLQFDPHHYSYGGGYLYPLGLWFFVLKQANIIQTGDLRWMIDNPQAMDSIYLAGRVFILVTFFISALFLYSLLKTIRNQKFALVASLIYLSTPSLLMFSVVMKPHVYALLWTNIALFLLVKAYYLEKLTYKNSIMLGLVLGMAVGSVVTYALFAVMVWVGLLYYAWKGKLRYVNLLLVPSIAIFVFFLVNPFIILNYDAFLLETTAQQSWFFLGGQLEYLWLFVTNSLLPGFGIGVLSLLIYVISFLIFNPSMKGMRPIGLSILLIISFISFISASVSTWHINSRYIFYMVPVVLTLYALRKEASIKFLNIILLVTLLQTFPLFLAYYDEDSLEYSTRLRAAEWINKNIPIGNTVCTTGRSIAPYDSPPFDFMRIKVDRNQCDFLISIERQSDRVLIDFDKELMVRFEPRFNIKAVPLVYSHINPQISIYRN